MYNYILHPTNLRNRDLELEMRIEEGSRGYGIYIMILELMRDADKYRLKNRPKSIAFAINETDADIVARIINDYGLFQQEEEVYFYSPWLRETLAEMDAKRAALSAAGRRGAAARTKSEHAEPSNPEQTSNSQAEATPKPPSSQAKPKPSLSQAEAKPKPPLSNKSINKLIDKSTNQSSDKKFVCDGDEVIGYDVIDYICRSKGLPVSDEDIEIQVPNDGQDHNTAYILRICRENDIPRNVMGLLMRITNYGEVGGRRMMQLIKIMKKCQQDGFKPLYWGNYLVKKMEELG